MPFRSRFRRRFVRRSRGSRRQYSKGTRRPVNRLNRATRGLNLLATELKFLDHAITTQYFSTTAGTTLLNGCASGTTASSRVGRSIVMKSISLDLLFHFAKNITPDVQSFRIVLVQDRQANAVETTYAAVFGASGTVTSHKEMEYRDRFYILMDKVFTLRSDSTVGSSRQLKLYKRVNIPVSFNAGVTGNVSDILTNSLHLIWKGDTALNGVNHPYMTGNCRIRFADP